MITRLSIQGLAIIDSLSIEFSSGFNVITGETGAGKSILIRALHFLMGAKATAEAVRKGSAQASVQGEFTVPPAHPAAQMLRGLGLPVDEAGGEVPIFIRRQLTAKGRSQAWINDVAVTSQPLRELGMKLVDLFGQHENQRLMDAGRHVEYLDGFLKDPKALETVRLVGADVAEQISLLRRAVETFQTRQRNRDYLDFRLKELKEFDPGEEDFERIEVFCQMADRQGAVREGLARALQCLEGGEGETGVSKAVWETSRALQSIHSPEAIASSLQELKERAAHAASALDDLSYDLGKLLSTFEFDASELEAAQERLYGYQDLFRKHAVKEIRSLVGEKDRLETELASLESMAQEVGTRLDALKSSAASLLEAVQGLTRARKQAAKLVKAKVEAELQQLAMPGAAFEAEFQPLRRALPELDLGAFGEGASARYRMLCDTLGHCTEGGAERVQFLLSSNPGEPILPLTRVASGGELSRIMLALKKALAADAETCVLVFDEVDTGISGRVADVVGKKMRELADSFQVICISHLPQVAVYADSHFLVKKVSRSDRTESTIVKLSTEESAREIARLLSGAEVSTPSLANAKSLIAKARQGKSRKAAGTHATSA